MQAASGLAPEMWGPSIVGFGRYPAASGEWPRMGFSPRKAKLVLYVSLPDGVREAMMPRLAPAATGAGCIYVSDLSKMDGAALTDLCREAWANMAARYPPA